jgi:hypothetical protein
MRVDDGLILTRFSQECLVSSETNKRRYAERVAAYVSKRAELFGSSRTKKELSLTVREARWLLRQEQFWTVVLPQKREAGAGGTKVPAGCVCFVNGSVPWLPLSSCPGARERLKCLFYLASAICVAQEGSVAVVVALPGADVDNFLVDDVGRNLEAFLNFLFLLPIELESLHIVAIEEEEEDGDDDEEDTHIDEVLESFHANLSSKIRGMSKIHLVSSREGAAASLEMEGFPRADVPPFLGGTLQHEGSLWWLREQTRDAFVETASGVARADGQEPLTTADSGPGFAAAAAAFAPSASASNHHDIEFIRKRNAIYAKRKYDRKKIEVEVLHQQYQDLREQKQRLQRESRRLERLLAEANGIVARSQAAPTERHGRRSVGDRITSSSGRAITTGHARESSAIRSESKVSESKMSDWSPRRDRRTHGSRVYDESLARHASLLHSLAPFELQGQHQLPAANAFSIQAQAQQPGHNPSPVWLGASPNLQLVRNLEVLRLIRQEQLENSHGRFFPAAAAAAAASAGGMVAPAGAAFGTESAPLAPLSALRSQRSLGQQSEHHDARTALMAEFLLRFERENERAQAELDRQRRDP